MPLKLEFKSGDKLMINGAVIENIGANAKILVHNEAAILRNKEVLSETDEATPAARVYLPCNAPTCSPTSPTNT